MCKPNLLIRKGKHLLILTILTSFSILLTLPVLAQEKTVLQTALGEPSDVVLKYTAVKIPLGDADTYKANYDRYIASLRGNLQNLDLNGVDMSGLTAEAVRKQVKSPEMNQKGVVIVYGLENPDAPANKKIFYEMVYPIDYNGQILTVRKRDYVYGTRLPTRQEASLTDAVLRDILNCPPYCD